MKSSQLKILLAEDDPNISVIVKMALESLGGHKVFVVENGQKAVERAQKEKFDLILLDEMMPVMNGLKACEEIKNSVESHPPIIFLSAKSQEQDVRQFKAMGLGYLPKPFDPAKICQQLTGLLHSSLKETGS
jgi:two-component system alkaline phosphatase synthesis response regulator PhoP